MYVSIEEAAEYLQLSKEYIESLIHQGKIRAVHDGQQYLINRDQFAGHLEQMEKAKKQWEEWNSEPMPEDPDIKDED